MSQSLTLSAIIIEEPPWTPRTGSCVWTERKSRIWAMASWSVPSANTMPWSRVRDSSSHTSERRKHTQCWAEGVCVCVCETLVAMWLTCVIMVFGSVWFILSVTTEISMGSPGRRGGRSSWSETWRVWPMTTTTLRAGGFWEATGIIIWENRSNTQPATPIIPWKRQAYKTENSKHYQGSNVQSAYFRQRLSVIGRLGLKPRSLSAPTTVKAQSRKKSTAEHTADNKNLISSWISLLKKWKGMLCFCLCAVVLSIYT